MEGGLKEKWLKYEACQNIIDVSKPFLNGIWQKANKNGGNVSWRSFLPIFWEELGVSKEPKITENEGIELCLKNIFNIQSDGQITKFKYDTFVQLYAACCPIEKTFVLGDLFLKTIIDLNKECYFGGHMLRDDVENTLKSSPAFPDSFLVRISTSKEETKRFVVSSYSKKVHELHTFIEREHYYKDGVIAYVELEIKKKLGLTPINLVKPKYVGL